MLKDKDWDFILNTILNEKCVLLLGPEVCVLENGKQYEEALLERLDVVNNDYIVSYYEEEGLFLFKDGPSKTRSFYDIKSFYNQDFRDMVYTKLTEIPLHLIVSITPDHNLQRVFKSRKIPHYFEYYDKTSNPQEVEAPSKNSPLIYNLFGSIEKEESMILTHDDLFDFLLKILGTRNLPDVLKDALIHADNFIFLGFRFDTWYVQLLLRLLNLHNKNYKFARFASNEKIKEEVREMIIDQFEIEFTEVQIEDFITRLYDKCKEQGILRDPNAPDISTAMLVDRCLEEDQLDKAFSALKTFFEENDEEDHLDTLAMLMNKHKRLLKRQVEETIDEKDANITYNKIVSALNELNKEVKALEKEGVND